MKISSIAADMWGQRINPDQNQLRDELAAKFKDGIIKEAILKSKIEYNIQTNTISAVFEEEIEIDDEALRGAFDKPPCLNCGSTTYEGTLYTLDPSIFRIDIQDAGVKLKSKDTTNELKGFIEELKMQAVTWIEKYIAQSDMGVTDVHCTLEMGKIMACNAILEKMEQTEDVK